MFLKKSQKTSYFENYKDLSSHIWRQDSQPLIVLWHNPTTGLGTSRFINYFVFEISENILKKISKNVLSRKFVLSRLRPNSQPLIQY